MSFNLVDSNLYDLPNCKGRFVHLASVNDGLKEYVAFVDRITSRCYIEDITGGTLVFIEDDNVAEDLAAFLSEKKLLDPRRILNGH